MSLPPRLSIVLGTFIISIALAARPPIQARLVVLDNPRVIDGTGKPPIERARVVIEGDHILYIGAPGQMPLPPQSEVIDLAGRTIIPGLIDLHFHIEKDPKLALRQLSHGVTAFRDPGQWNERFGALRAMMADDHLPGPRIFTTGPHIDGEHPAYPADSVVARDAEEARRLAERNVRQGASALKIYFRLPLASVKAVIDVCHERSVPCTAHLEIIDARELIEAGLNGIEHITSLGIGLLPQVDAEAYRQAILAENDARRDGRYRMFSTLDLDGLQARALYATLGDRHPWIDPTLAVFERRADRPLESTPPELAATMVAGFTKMKQLTRRAGEAGARLVMGGHSTVPFADRGEAPWRELELLVESGLTPLEAITAATGTAAAFLYRSDEFGTLRPGLKADLVVLSADPSRDISAVRKVNRVMVGGVWIDLAKYSRY